MAVPASLLAAGWLAVLLLPALPVRGGAETVLPLGAAYRQPPEHWPAPWIDEGVAFAELAAMPPAGQGADADEAGKAALGGQLFGDPRLAADGAPACAGCHHPDHGWSIPAAVAVGHEGRRGKRNPPALHAVARQPFLGWDGGGAELAAQALAPLTLAHEMGNAGLGPVLARIRGDADLRARFHAHYGDGGVSAAALGDALAAFLRTLDRPSRFDRFLAGDHGQLSDLEIEGLHLFRTKARCANCHFGPLLADGRFHNLGISFFGEPSQDLGRYRVTGRPGDVGAFRTASLRHVAGSAPYMHNGLFRTLEGVINLYDRGGGETWARGAAEAAHPLYAAAARKSPQLRPLGLTAAEKSALLAFLKTL
ncbi:cytochrome-c peroxidase [Thauera linaloolentis]|uniref:Di-heme cytochrome c peroxidase n=1 Tax=Thauera linaloolentis (strain DSM 12138 / JCM 21573 / CCUG 41526 / CIP 105981 / IAM 15112 / NBRC 102519 / 47Lol) TaxID=1123367 RepID=N6XZ35_THAL4|nr:cytochrome c peroxidase [Thauera linaloolentis]ENO84510.1 di-heme cytochrome c peroxidase [Thauera linaloolentis 47Lol = DSM 12138]MCM8565248.1 cytochrome-c peroxidase [Thauera linaloolentis]